MNQRLLLIALTLACTPVVAQTTRISEAPQSTTQRLKPAELDTSSSIDQVLQALDDKGQSMVSLRAGVSLAEDDMAVGGTKTRTGSIWLEKRPLPTGTRLRVQFDTYLTEKTKAQEQIDYLMEGDWLIDRNYKMKQEVRRQIRRPGDNTDPLKLGEGPFPLPIGQPAEAVKAEFEITRLPEDPVFNGLIGLELRPRPGSQLVKRLESLTMWVDPATSFPAAIQTIDINLTTLRTTRFNDVMVNAKISDDDFALQPIQDWKLIEEPLD